MNIKQEFLFLLLFLSVLLLGDWAALYVISLHTGK